MTTKERLHKLVDELTEAEADDALRYVASRRECDDAQERADLEAMLDEEGDELLDELDAREQNVSIEPKLS
jgi:hypothetical protein